MWRRIHDSTSNPGGSEEVPVQISALEAHEIILKEARDMGEEASEGGDDGTNALIVRRLDPLD